VAHVEAGVNLCAVPAATRFGPFACAFIGGTVEVAGKMFDGVKVTIDGGLSVVAALEFFEHDLAKMGHREVSFL
jgi:hypothetical protein